MNVWCTSTHERVITVLFFDEDIITSSSFLDMLENCTLLQLSNTSNLILTMDSAPARFAHFVHDGMNFQNHWVGIQVPVAHPAPSSDLRPLDFFVWAM
jgi:hypothetical protein